jgi:hypothetical protein
MTVSYYCMRRCIVIKLLLHAAVLLHAALYRP